MTTANKSRIRAIGAVCLAAVMFAAGPASHRDRAAAGDTQVGQGLEQLVASVRQLKSKWSARQISASEISANIDELMSDIEDITSQGAARAVKPGTGRQIVVAPVERTIEAGVPKPDLSDAERLRLYEKRQRDTLATHLPGSRERSLTPPARAYLERLEAGCRLIRDAVARGAGEVELDRLIGALDDGRSFTR